jgi:drug/metabolite transporter (DMT)-like permease
MNERMQGLVVTIVPVLIWAVEPLWVKAFLLPEMSAAGITFYKFLLAGLFLLPLSRSAWPVLGQLTIWNWLAVGMIALVGSVMSSYLFMLALGYANVGTVILFEKMQSLFVILIGVLIFRYRPPWLLTVLVSAAMLLSSVIVLDGRWDLAVFQPWWLPLVLLAMPFGFGLVTVLAKYILGLIPPLLLTQLRIGLAAPFFLLLVIIPSGVSQILVPQPSLWFWLVLSAFSSYTVGFGLYYWGLKRISAVQATSIELMGPIFGALGALFWLNEGFSRLQWVIGAVLLLVIFGITQFEEKAVDVVRTIRNGGVGGKEA